MKRLLTALGLSLALMLPASTALADKGGRRHHKRHHSHRHYRHHHHRDRDYGFSIQLGSPYGSFYYGRRPYSYYNYGSYGYYPRYRYYSYPSYGYYSYPSYGGYYYYY